MEYLQEGSDSVAIPPTSVSDVVGQQNKTESITVRAALVIYKDFAYSSWLEEKKKKKIFE